MNIHLNSRTKYKLWTFQSIVAIEQLQKSGILKSALHTYNMESHFTKSYGWMMKQMHAKKIDCTPNTLPIWAWHSCKLYSKPPRLIDARSLLSDVEIEAGIQTIEFECPTELALLSNYGLWNAILEKFYLANNNEPIIDRKTQRKLFSTGRNSFKKYDSIQASLPYLKLTWVKDIRKLDLIPGDYSYKHEKLV